MLNVSLSTQATVPQDPLAAILVKRLPASCAVLRTCTRTVLRLSHFLLVIIALGVVMRVLINQGAPLVKKGFLNP